jgi:hypothetical protein
MTYEGLSYHQTFIINTFVALSFLQPFSPLDINALGGFGATTGSHEEANSVILKLIQRYML